MSDIALTIEREKDKDAPVYQTGGQKVFNLATYYGIGWVANALSSVYLTDKAFNRQNGWEWLHDGRKAITDTLTNVATQHIAIPENLNAFTSQHFADVPLTNQALHDLWEENGGSFEALAAQLEGNFTAENLKKIRDYVVHLEVTNDTVTTMATIITLCSGGFLLMAPIKWLEDAKRPIVEFLDDKVVDPLGKLTGHAPRTEEEKHYQRAQRQQSYIEIENAPKQTWGSVFASRVAALIPVYLFHGAMSKPNNIIKSGIGSLTGAEYVNPSKDVGFGGTEYYFNKTGDAVGSGLLNLTSDNFKNTVNKEAFKEKTEWLITDFSYSLVAATATYWCTRIFAPFFSKDKEENSTQFLPTPVTNSPLTEKSAHVPASKVSEPTIAVNTVTPFKRVDDFTYYGAVAAEVKPKLTIPKN